MDTEGLLDTEVDRLRSETPGVQCGTVHFNNAGASLPSTATVQATVNYLHVEARIGGYEAVEECQPEVTRAYTALALLINCHPSEIAIVSSATEAWQQVVYGLHFKPGDRILTCLADYGSNRLAFLQLQKRHGVVVEVIPDTPVGDVDLEALEAAITNNSAPVALVAINHIPTGSGRVYNASGVGRVCRRHAIPFLLDACQSVGQCPVDVASIGCTFLTATSRKFLRGPRGAGFLYIASNALQWHEPGHIDVTGATWTAETHYCLQPTAKRYEQYEMCIAAKVGLGVAVDQLLTLGIDRVWQRIQYLAEELRARLRRVSGVLVHDHGAVLCGIVTFTKQGISADGICTRMRAKGIHTSVSAVTSNRTLFEGVGLQAVVRASVHYYNTLDEVATLVAAVAEEDQVSASVAEEDQVSASVAEEDQVNAAVAEEDQVNAAVAEEDQVNGLDNVNPDGLT